MVYFKNNLPSLLKPNLQGAKCRTEFKHSFTFYLVCISYCTPKTDRKCASVGRYFGVEYHGISSRYNTWDIIDCAINYLINNIGIKFITP
jgi:hypothetical protein